MYHHVVCDVLPEENSPQGQIQAFLNWITCSCDNHMWSRSIAKGHNLLPTQDINPARLNSALKVSEA